MYVEIWFNWNWNLEGGRESWREGEEEGMKREREREHERIIYKDIGRSRGTKNVVGLLNSRSHWGCTAVNFKVLVEMGCRKQYLLGKCNAWNWNDGGFSVIIDDTGWGNVLSRGVNPTLSACFGNLYGHFWMSKGCGALLAFNVPGSGICRISPHVEECPK